MSPLVIPLPSPDTPSYFLVLSLLPVVSLTFLTSHHLLFSNALIPCPLLPLCPGAVFLLRMRRRGRASCSHISKNGKKKTCNRHLSKRAGPHSPSMAPAEEFIPGVLGGSRGHFAFQLALPHLPTDASKATASERCMKCQAVINICHFGVIDKSETKCGSRAFGGKSNNVAGGKSEELKTFDNSPR